MRGAITRVNLGSGELLLDGWTNVDAYVAADITEDCRDLDFTDLDEVYTSHMLEHLAWGDVPPLLRRIRGWLKPGGKLTIEVPDMAAIMANPGDDWVIYVYGSQSHEGEFHRSGFTQDSLSQALANEGYSGVNVAAFLSEHPFRPGMPCLLAVAYA